MWLCLALLVAVLTSAQDICSKRLLKEVGVYTVCWAWWFFSLPLLYGALLFVPFPKLDFTFWMTLGFGSVLLVVAVIFYIKALEASDLSISVPMLSFSPLFLLATSPVMLKEFPRPIGILGVVLIVAGSYMFFIKERKQGLLAPFRRLFRERGARYMLIVAFIFSVTGNMDKIGVLHSSPVVWLVMLNTSASLFLTIFMFKKARNIKATLKIHWKGLFTIGLINAAALVIQMIAITMTMVPYLISVKRTSVIMSALFGFFILKEPGIKERLSAICLMIIGVFLISIS